MLMPDRIPLMPLPGGVLFPGEVMPLVLFEPRYRRMLGDVLDGSRFFAVGMIRPGIEEAKDPDPTFRVVGAGLVRAAVRSADRTGHLLLLGMCRARIEAMVATRPYRVIRIAALRDRPAVPARPALIERAAGIIAAALEARRARGGEPAKALVELLSSIRDPSRLADAAAFHLLARPAHRQVLLETLDVERRIERLRDLLACELENPAPEFMEGDDGSAAAEEDRAAN